MESSFSPGTFEHQQNISAVLQWAIQLVPAHWCSIARRPRRYTFLPTFLISVRLSLALVTRSAAALTVEAQSKLFITLWASFSQQ